MSETEGTRRAGTVSSSLTCRGSSRHQSLYVTALISRKEKWESPATKAALRHKAAVRASGFLSAGAGRAGVY